MSDFKLYLLVNNQELDITDNVEYGVTNLDGMGMPPVNWISESGPLQHGVTVKDYKINPRVITITVDALSESVTEQFTDRSELIDYLNFTTDVIKLKVEYPSSKTRYIDCHLMAGLSFPSRVNVGLNQKAVFQLFCPDPAFYDPDRQIVGFGGEAISISGWVVPMFMPTFLGTSILEVDRTVEYEGSYEEFPIIEVKGPVTNLVIRNITTGEKLDFGGTVIESGETYEIDTRYGYKTVTASGINVIATLSDDSDLATFHLDRKLAGESFHPNSITVSGIGINSQSVVYMRYYNRYIGV